MSKKAILVTFTSIVTVLILTGLASYWVSRNQPTADVTPPVPPVPQKIALSTTDRPPVPSEPRISGDAQDDGTVNGLDISVLVTNWQKAEWDYDLVNGEGGENIINALDISNVISHWRCLEQKDGCPYINK
jgi:hypothetical protein